MEFSSEGLYIASKTGAAARIVAIDACIDALMTSVLAACGKSSTQEYFLDDGQTKIKKVYRSTGAVISAVEDLERIKTYYQNQINGRSVKMMDAKNFRRY